MQTGPDIPPLAVERIAHVVELLSDGLFDEVLDECSDSQLKSDALQEAVREYGRTIIPVPVADMRRSIDAVQVRGRTHPTWSVRVQLWTREEGRSDLTLEVTVSMDGGRVSIQLEDLHVL
jgi:hypothetical protein